MMKYQSTFLPIKFYLIGCLFFLATTSLIGQATGTDWSSTLTGNNNESILDVIETSNGQLIAVGEAGSTNKRGKEGLVVISNFSTGTTIKKLFLGGEKDDVIHAIVPHWDGTFILAGHTSSKGKSSKEAWLVNIDQAGNVLWERTYGSTKADEFTAVGITKSGKIVAVGKMGTQKGRAWVVLSDKENFLEEYHLGKGEFDQVKDLVITNDDKLVMTGTTAKANRKKAGDAWLMQANLNGVIEWQRTYGENDWEEALALTKTTKGYAIAGLTKSKGAGDMDMWLINTDEIGSVLWDQTYGGGDKDIAHDVVQTYDGGFTIIGITKSHTSGARRYNTAMVKTDKTGQLIWEEDFGGNREDSGNSVFQLHDGSVLFAGSTASKSSDNKQAWLLKTLPNQEDVHAAVPGDLQLSSVQFLSGTTSDILSVQNRGYLNFEVTNQSPKPLLHVVAEVNPVLQVEGISFQEKVTIGTLQPLEVKRVSIPVKGKERLEKGMSTFQINILSDHNILASTQTSIFSDKVKPAALAFGGHHFSSPSLRSGGNYKATLEVNIQNFGEQSAQDIKGIFKVPEGVQSLGGSNNFTINYLRPNSAHIAAFEFVVSATGNYPNGKVPVTCLLANQNTSDTIRSTFTLDINKPASQVSGVRSPKSSKDLIWLSPNPDESGRNIISDKEFVDIKIKAVSNNELKADDFTIYLNNTAQDGSKTDPPTLSKANRKGADYTQTYENRVQLKLGKNEIEVEVYDEAGNVKTVPIIIDFIPERPNLHVLAIGPHHQDLEYTGQDAKDFANAFTNQENKLFNKVFVKALSTKGTTKKNDIQKALLDLQYNYESSSEEAITDKDLLIIFISSHAKRDGRNFLILPSDYSPKYEAIYSLDYERDIVQYLKNINCKKLMFIDACNSGAAYASVSGTKSVTDEGLAAAINKINSTLSGMSTFTSCQKREKSYEDRAWKNGAFTEGILEALDNRPFADRKGRNFRADTDNNGILTIGELKNFLAKRVPYLVKTQKADAPTTQVPLLTNNELGDEFPLYVLDQNK